MVILEIHWTEQATKEQWTFDIEYTICIYIWISDRDLGYLPLELWNRQWL